MTSIGQGRSKSENKMKQEGDDRYREGQIRFKWDDFPSHFGCQARLPEVHRCMHSRTTFRGDPPTQGGREQREGAIPRVQGSYTFSDI